MSAPPLSKQTPISHGASFYGVSGSISTSSDSEEKKTSPSSQESTWSDIGHNAEEGGDISDSEYTSAHSKCDDITRIRAMNVWGELVQISTGILGRLTKLEMESKLALDMITKIGDTKNIDGKGEIRGKRDSLRTKHQNRYRIFKAKVLLRSTRSDVQFLQLDCNRLFESFFDYFDNKMDKLL